MGHRRVVLVWRKRLWRCPDPDCEVKTFSEETDAIAPRAVFTERARAAMCRRVGRDGHSVASVARDFGVSWHGAMQAVRDYGRPRVDHLSRLRMPSAIGIDETSFLAANAFHPALLATGFVDLDRHRLIGVVPGRSAAAVSEWLAAKTRAVAGGHRHRGHRPLRRLCPGGWPRVCPQPAWSSTTPTPCAWPTRPSTRCADGCSRPASATEAGRVTRSMLASQNARRLLLRCLVLGGPTRLGLTTVHFGRHCPAPKKKQFEHRTCDRATRARLTKKAKTLISIQAVTPLLRLAELPLGTDRRRHRSSTSSRPRSASGDALAKWCRQASRFRHAERPR